MNLAGYTAIYPGYLQGQQAAAAAADAQAAAAMRQAQLKEYLAEQGASLGDIASLFQGQQQPPSGFTQTPPPPGAGVSMMPMPGPAQGMAPGSAAPGATFLPQAQGAPQMMPQMALQGAAGGAGTPSPGPGLQQAQMPASQQTGAFGGMEGMGPQPTFGQIFMRIKQANPGMSDATVLAMTAKVQQVVNPADKMYLQYLMGQQRLQTQQRGQDLTAAYRQQALAQHDAEFQEAQRGLEGRFQERLAARPSPAQAQQIRAQKLQVQAINAQIRQINTQLASAGYMVGISGVSTDLTDQQKSLLAQRDQLQNQIIQMYNQMSGETVPKASAAPAAPATGATGPAAPAGAAAASGPTATDANGNKVQWNGTTWVPVAK